jgi:ribose transport system substrate-binding protein
MLKTKYLQFLLIGILVLLLVACGGAATTDSETEAPADEDTSSTSAEPEEEAEAETPAEESGPLKIGFSVYDMQYGFFQDMEAGTKDAAEALGYEYILVDQKKTQPKPLDTNTYWSIKRAANQPWYPAQKI